MTSSGSLDYQTNDGDGDGSFLTPRQIRWVVVGLMIGMFMSTLDVLIVITAMPTIAGDLGGGSIVAWMITAYLLAATISGPLYGKLSDLYGRQRLYEIALLGFILGSIFAGLSQDIYQLILSRALQGLGAGGMQVLPYAIIADVASPRERARYQGVMAINFAIASVLGPLIGGLFVDHSSWRMIFFVNLPIGVAALVAAHRMPLRHLRPKRVSIDFVGCALLGVSATCLLLVVTWGGNDHAWSSPIIIGLIVGGVVFGGLLVVQEHRAEDPLIPPHLFHHRYFNLIVLASLLMAIPMHSSWVLLPVFLQVVTKASATDAGMLLLPFVFGNTVATVVAGRLVARWGRYKWSPVLGSFIATVGFFLYATMGVDTPRITASAYMFVTGAGIGMILQVVVVMVQNSVAYRDLGTATSTISFLRSLGFSLGSALGYSIFIGRFNLEVDRLVPDAVRRSIPVDALQGSPEAVRNLPADVQALLTEAFANGLHLAFLVMAPLGLLAFFVLLAVRDIRPDDVPADLASQFEDAPVD